MPRGAIWKALFSIAKGTVADKRFNSYRGSTFVLSRRTSLDHNTATLRYQEGASHFDITAEEDVDGGFSMNIDEMGAQSPGYTSLPVSEKVRIAENIRDALATQSIPCQVIANHRPL